MNAENVPANSPSSTALPPLRTGMTIRVHERVRDVNAKGEARERLQVFEGMILRLRGAGISRTMTVRKISEGIGVEKIYPVASPFIARVDVLKKIKTRRAHLGFARSFTRKFKEKK